MVEFAVDDMIAEIDGAAADADQTPAEGADAPKQDAVETLAADLGWKPDGELDAKAYILKSKDIQDTMRNHIKDQKSQLSDLGSAVKELKSHNERVYKAEVSQLKDELAALKTQKKEAIEDGDVEEVEKLDDKIDGVKEAMSKPKKDDTPEGTDPEFEAWVKDNKWYLDDEEMAAYANKIADDNAGAPFKRVTDLIGRKVKDMFPEKFEAKPELKPSPVEGAARRIAVSKFTESDLTPGQKSVMNQFVSQGIMTKKQYIQDIATTQGA